MVQIKLLIFLSPISSCPSLSKLSIPLYIFCNVKDADLHLLPISHWYWLSRSWLFLVPFVKSSLATAAKLTSVTLTSENFSFSVMDWKPEKSLWEVCLPHQCLCWWPVVLSLLCFHTCLFTAVISALKLKVTWSEGHLIVLSAESLEEQGQVIDFSNIN